MPELPEVETCRRYFNATALHQKIARIHVHGAALLVDTSPQGLGRALKDHTFDSTCRHGKYLFAKLDSGNWLVLHFGMSGLLDYGRSAVPQYTQLAIEFNNDYRLAYVAPRKLGHIALTDSPKHWVEMKKLGPDALALSSDDFLRLAASRHGAVKPWLMDQHSIAGIGNLYSDEVLFQSRIHPRRAVADLSEAELKAIHRKLREALDTSVAVQADPDKLPKQFLLPHRHEGGHCPRCGSNLQNAKIGGRTSWFCPHCQKT
ncbi:Fpg/Nei family DNA glycosylase [Microbulbifer hainanensis]|uniref:Fpg/Nei family DNA glycosylase n=1 Tax=Microbulbifer hainanensis TaxID=2735675 RepID=UPI0018689E94|nr:DNA-formamidopyrimidine glycosylase family protein [Microbulbifer hainanensis]